MKKVVKSMDIQKEASASAPIIETTTTPSGLTIIRLKRKRNEEPLDALGILIILSKTFPFDFFQYFINALFSCPTL